MPYSGNQAEEIVLRKHKLNWSTALVMGLFHVGRDRRPVHVQLAVLRRSRFPLLGGYRSGNQHGIPPAAHTPVLSECPLWLEYFLRVLRHADARRRADLLGGDASHPPSEIRSAGRSAFAARRRLVVAHGLDHVRRSQPQQHAVDVEVRSRSGKASVLRLAEQLSLGADGRARRDSAARRRIADVLWGVFLRVVFGLHATWLVNSATHMWGGRRFATRDDSRNNWWVALITFGEGWHNNHHAHPTSARHGLAWYEFDPSWILLKHAEVLRDRQDRQGCESQ